MAFIDHRCPCGHRLTQHRGPGNCTADAGKGCARPCSKTLPAPEVMPSWDLKGRPVKRIVPPGEDFGNHFTTHDCETCRALYEQVAEPAEDAAPAAS